MCLAGLTFTFKLIHLAEMLLSKARIVKNKFLGTCSPHLAPAPQGSQVYEVTYKCLFCGGGGGLWIKGLEKDQKIAKERY